VAEASAWTENEIADLVAKVDALKESMGRVIIGQRDVIDLLVTCLLGGGHALVEGVPGLGKTLLVKSLAQATDMQFRRVQFTPDLMPSDIGHAPARVPLPAGPRVHAGAARRRDQPRAAQDTVRAAGSDAGALRHVRRTDT
jgi:MoxR-like ATPase